MTICAIFISATLFAQNQFQTETTNQINFAAGKVLKLAEAIPADKFSWSPEGGVRSVAGVCAYRLSKLLFCHEACRYLA